MVDVMNCIDLSVSKKEPFANDEMLKNDIQNNDDILNEECNICMSRGVNDVVECHICHKKLCTICCNYMKSIQYNKEVKNKDNCGVLANYKCPYCNCNRVSIPFSKFTKNDLLEIIKLDYIRFMEIATEMKNTTNKYNDLCIKTSQLEQIKERNNNNEVIQFLMNENEELRSIAEPVGRLIIENKSLVEQLKIERSLTDDNEKKIKVLKDTSKRLLEENNKMKEYCNSVCKANNDFQTANDTISSFLKDALDTNKQNYNMIQQICNINNDMKLKPKQKYKAINNLFANTDFVKLDAKIITGIF